MAVGYNVDINGTYRYGLKGISSDIEGEFNYSPLWTVWMNDIDGGFNYVNDDIFPSMVAKYEWGWVDGEWTQYLTDQIATVSEETIQMFGVKVYLNGSLVPGTDVKDVWVRWPLNAPITFGCTFRNWEATYTTSTLPDNIRYVKIVFEGAGGSITFPKMIIKERSGGWELTVTGVDALSNILYEPVSLEEYVARESATRESQTTYTVEGITLGSRSPAFRVIINYSEGSGTLSGGTLTVAPIIDEDIPVSVEAPYYAKWVLNNLFSQLKDANTIQKQFNFSDFLIYENIPVWKTPPIEIVNQIVEAIPGEWYIQPSGSFYKLVINKLNMNTPTGGAGFVLNENLYKSPPSIQNTLTKGFNTINVIRPAVRDAAVYSWQDIADTSIEEVTIDFGGQKGIIDTIQCIKTDETGDGGYIELLEYIGVEGTTCRGVKIAIVVVKEHEFEGETIETPYSMLGYKIVWQTEQGSRRSQPSDNATNTYEGYAPLTDAQWNNYLNILTEGINVEVTTAATDKDIIRADSNITNGMIPSIQAAIDIGRENIRLSNINQTFSCSIVPAFGFELIPGKWAHVQYDVLNINDSRKIKEVYISCANQQVDLTFIEGVAV